MKKIFLVTITLCGTLILVGTTTTAPILQSLKECYDITSARLEENIVKSEKEEWGRYQLCLNGEEVLISFEECYRKTKNKTRLPPSIVEFITYLAKLIRPNIMDINDLKNYHNETCKDFPATIVE